MKTYEEIKSELLEIADVLKKYPDNIQPQVFEILTRHFLGQKVEQTEIDDTSSSIGTQKEKNTKVGKPKNPKQPSKSKESINLLKDLNLRPAGEKSFKDFYDEKKPGKAYDFNAVAVYYLIEIAQITNITPSHIYTCYKEVDRRPPEAFRQSLLDTARRNGYIDTADTNDIKIPLRGRNYVEHDLPKQKTKK